MQKTGSRILVYFIIALGVGFFLPEISKRLINIKSLFVVFEQRQEDSADKAGQIAQVARGLKGVQAKTEQLKNGFQQAQQKIKQLEAEKISARKELAQISTEFLRNTGEFQLNKEQSRQWQSSQLSALKQKIGELGSATQARGQQYDKLMDLFVRLQERELALYKSNVDLNQKINALVKEKEGLEKNIGNFQNNSDEQNKLTAAMRQENKILAEKLAGLQANLKSLRAENDQLSAQLKQISALLSQKDQEISKLKNEPAKADQAAGKTETSPVYPAGKAS